MSEFTIELPRRPGFARARPCGYVRTIQFENLRRELLRGVGFESELVRLVIVYRYHRVVWPCSPIVCHSSISSSIRNLDTG